MAVDQVMFLTGIALGCLVFGAAMVAMFHPTERRREGAYQVWGLFLVTLGGYAAWSLSGSWWQDGLSVVLLLGVVVMVWNRPAPLWLVSRFSGLRQRMGDG
jgi:hypothetical protein